MNTRVLAASFLVSHDPRRPYVYPEGVQSNFKVIEKPWVSIVFLSIGVIWNLSGGAQAAFCASREALLGM